MHEFFEWFAGGDTPYMRLSECLHHDAFWMYLTVGLDIAVALGYLLIALHWRRNCRMMPATPARRALNNMRNIFLLCGICGYLFVPVKMIWPAWRLYDMFLMVLVYFTWDYAWGARDLKVIYSELGRSSKLVADLERTREESRQKSIFLNSISHDLRTPLNGLVLQANLARVALESNNSAAVRQALAEMESGAYATSDFLDRILEYGRLNVSDEQTHPVCFRLQPLIDQIFRTYAPTASAKGLQLVSKVPALVLRTDSLKLERILNNLVHNGIKFTQTGSVTVSVECTANSVELHVTDTGIGIGEEDRKRLFDEFFQVHNRERDPAKGFGLGLAIAHRLALQLGGDLTVESAPGRGTRFSILLPGAMASEADLAAATAGVPAVAT